MAGRCIFALCVFFLVLMPLMAEAAPRFTGRYLLSMCSSDDKGRELTEGGHLACQAYLAGVIDYHKMMRTMGGSYSVDFCVPDHESMGVIQGNVVRYLQRNRKLHDQFIATPAVTLALSIYYPCKKKK